MDEQKHMFQAGHLLVLMIWVQNIMSDLLILKKNEDILNDFKKFGNKENFGIQRNAYWQKSFPEIKREFLESFPDIAVKYTFNFELLQHLRDFFAHARYSLKTDLIFYQPTKSRRDLQKKIKTLTKIPFDESQTFLKIKMDEAKYEEIFDELMKFENIIFPTIAEELGINLNRLK